MPNLRVGNKTGKELGKTASNCTRYIFEDVRRNEVPALVERLKATPGYCAHRAMEQPNGRYKVYAYV